MELETQAVLLPIHNYDNTSNKIRFRRHSTLFGGSCKRGLIVGPSGCGKTNILISLLLHSNGLRFKNIYICSKSLHQHKYNFLKNVLDSISEIGYYEYHDIHSMIPPEEVRDYSVVIFDDIPSIEQNVVKQFFSFGRHKNLDCFYLCQTYSAIPKQLIRDNSNFLILFRQDATNVKHVFNDHIHDLKYDQFINICQECWKQAHGTLVIDCDCNFNEGRYRLGFDTYIRI